MASNNDSNPTQSVGASSYSLEAQLTNNMR